MRLLADHRTATDTVTAALTRDQWNHLTVLLDNWDTIKATAEHLEPHPTAITSQPETWLTALDTSAEAALERRVGAIDRADGCGLSL